MQKSTYLCTIDQIIAALGGTKEAAEWAGVGESAVSNWLARGIPPGWHYRIDRELRQRGFHIDPIVFGVEALPHQQKTSWLAANS